MRCCHVDDSYLTSFSQITQCKPKRNDSKEVESN